MVLSCNISKSVRRPIKIHRLFMTVFFFKPKVNEYTQKLEDTDILGIKNPCCDKNARWFFIFGL